MDLYSQTGSSNRDSELQGYERTSESPETGYRINADPPYASTHHSNASAWSVWRGQPGASWKTREFRPRSVIRVRERRAIRVRSHNRNARLILRRKQQERIRVGVVPVFGFGRIPDATRDEYRATVDSSGAYGGSNAPVPSMSPAPEYQRDQAAAPRQETDFLFEPAIRADEHRAARTHNGIHNLRLGLLREEQQDRIRSGLGLVVGFGRILDVTCNDEYNEMLIDIENGGGVNTPARSASAAPRVPRFFR